MVLILYSRSSLNRPSATISWTGILVAAISLISTGIALTEPSLMISLCKQHGMALAFLASPNSPVERIETLSELSTGFVYLVSITGITGARDTLPSYLDDFVSRVRGKSELPVAVGFGISTPEQARMVGEVADGVIVGSALIKATDEGDDPIQAAGEFVKAMAGALQ